MRLYSEKQIEAMKKMPHTRDSILQLIWLAGVFVIGMCTLAYILIYP